MSESVKSCGFRTTVAAMLSALILIACSGGGGAKAPNKPPIALAGTDFTVDEGASARLEGSASDAEGAIASLSWQQSSGPAVLLSDASSANPNFTAPQVNARTELRFKLTVTDRDGLSVSDEVVVSVRDIPASNRAPAINAGLDQSVEEGAAVSLVGSASDEDGRIASQQWTQIAGPAVRLSNADSLTPSFTAPVVDAATVLGFRLTATDNSGASASDEVNVTVQDIAAPNQVPVADAGPEQDVEEGSAVTLLGSGRDDDGTVTSYQWTQTAGPTVTLSDASAAIPSFTAPQVVSDSNLRFQLVVGDDDGAVSAPDSVTVTVRDIANANQPPSVDAGGDQSVDEDAAVSLQGSATDNDGAVTSFAWTQISGPAVTLSGADTANASFTAPAVNAETELQFRLTATDNDGASSSDTVTVRVRDFSATSNQAPSANAGLDQSVIEGVTVNLVGTGTDGDGRIVSYRWTQTAGLPVSLTGADADHASFTAPGVDADRVLEFQLTVTDDAGASGSDKVVVTVRDSTATAAACASGKLCAGTAKRSISPTDAQVSGIDEMRLGQQTVQQLFHLGGFGFGPIETLGPANDYIAEEPAERATHCRGLKPTCADSERELTWVRAFYLAQPAATGAGTQTLFLTIDAVGAGNVIQKMLTEAVAAETGVPVANIMIGQTHSHAGADLQGLWGGVPQAWVQNILRLQSIAAAKAAMLDAHAADLEYATGKDSAFNNYRRPKATDPDADSDPQLSVLQARDSLGGVLGTLVQYSAHPTAIGTESGGALGRVPHPDYPLGLEDTLESSFGATAVFYNGPIADASGSGPTTGSDDYARVRSRGECLAKSVLTLLDPTHPQQCSFSLLKPAEVRKVKLAPSLEVRHATAILPVTNPLFLAAAPAGAFNRYYNFMPVTANDIPGLPPELVKQLNNGPQIAVTASTEVSRITIGGAGRGLEIVTIPGEGTNTFGQYIRGLAASPNMMLMGLTHNSFGYIIPEDEFSYVDPSGDAGFVAPFTGYEEFVSLGPLTAPLLRLQAYNPLFDLPRSDPRNFTPTLAACAADPVSRECLLSEAFFRVDYIQRSYAQQCRDNAPAEAASLCAMLDPDTPISAPCHQAGAPDGLCSVFGTGSGGTEPPPDEARPDRGSGVVGALAQFGAGLHEVIVALVGGDPATALVGLQTVLDNLGEDLGQVIAGDSNSLVALLTHLGDHLGSGDPQAGIAQASADAGAVVGLDTDPVSALKRTASAQRAVEAVVMTGNQLPGWSAPAAVGSPYPYPSGTGLIDQCLSAGAPEAFCKGLLGSLSGTPLDTTVRSAHNGVFFYPLNWKPGDAPAAGGVPVGEIAAYAYTDGAFHEIPVQVDEKYPYFLANSHSDFGVYSGTDEELSYAWDLERWNPGETVDGCSAVPPKGTPDPIAGLDDDDELVFMAKDAGAMAPTGAQPAEVPARASGQVITIADPLEPQTTRVVYLYLRSGGSSFGRRQHYVNYVRDANADQWIDKGFFADDDFEKLGTSNGGYGANLHGTVCPPGAAPRQSTDRFPRDGVTVQTDTYVWKATGRWMVREIGIAKPDGSGNYGADLIDRWKGRAFQQSPDSTISLVGFEDEQVNWEANSSLLGERCGPVRCMREVWGADSGTNVTKTETYYRDAVVSRYHVRVHPIPPDGLYTSWDYNRSAMVPTAAEQKAGVPGGRYFTILRPQGVPIDGINDDIGQVDNLAPVAGYCVTSDGPKPATNGRCPTFIDAADASFNLPLAFANWEQVSAKGDLGSMVYTFELKGATSLATPAVVPYYRDDACLDDGTGDDPVRRPYPGEASTDPRVVAGYKDLNGDGVVSCDEKQGVYGAHGIHYFASGDTDNAFVLGKPTTEIDGQQWQFMVPTAKPMNVGEPYANVARIPLKAVAVPINPPAPALPLPAPVSAGVHGRQLSFSSQLGGDTTRVAARR